MKITERKLNVEYTRDLFSILNHLKTRHNLCVQNVETLRESTVETIKKATERFYLKEKELNPYWLLVIGIMLRDKFLRCPEAAFYCGKLNFTYKEECVKAFKKIRDLDLEVSHLVNNLNTNNIVRHKLNEKLSHDGIIGL